jgi:hypothetical protein
LLDRGQEHQAQGEQLAQEQPAILTFYSPHNPCRWARESLAVSPEAHRPKTRSGGTQLRSAERYVCSLFRCQPRGKYQNLGGRRVHPGHDGFRPAIPGTRERLFYTQFCSLPQKTQALFLAILRRFVNWSNLEGRAPAIRKLCRERPPWRSAMEAWHCLFQRPERHGGRSLMGFDEQRRHRRKTLARSASEGTWRTSLACASG